MADRVHFATGMTSSLTSSKHRFAALALLAVIVPIGGCIGSAGDPDGEDVDSSEDAICPGGKTIHGVDVSSWQGSVDWHKAKSSGVAFGIARISDGTGYMDGHFDSNWKGMKSAGVVRGSYQFFRAGDSPTGQANLVLSALKKAGGFHPGDIPPALDIETNDGQSDKTVIARMHTWISKIQGALDRTPIIYTAPGFWSGLGNPKSFSNDDVWVAHWFVQCPTLPAGGFKTFQFWQYSDAGSVPGISGHVDMDRFNGDINKLHAYTEGADENGTQSLGGSVQTRPIIAKNADGRLEVFATNHDGLVETTFQQVGGGWSSWFKMDGDYIGAPGVGTIDDGRLMLTARDDKGTVWHSTQAGPNGKFGSWTSLGGDAAESPKMALDGLDRLHVFVIDGDGDISERHRDKNGSWSSWMKIANVPGALTGLAIGRRGDRQLAVFARGASDGEIYWVEETKTGAFTKPVSLGGDVQSAPTVGRNSDGRLEVFARAQDGTLTHSWEHTPGGSWSGWHSLGGEAHQPYVVSNHDGDLEVFARNQSDELVHIAQKKGGGGWGGWHALKTKIIGAPTATRLHDGRLSVFARVAKGKVIEVTQKQPGVF